MRKSRGLTRGESTERLEAPAGLQSGASSLKPTASSLFRAMSLAFENAAEDIPRVIAAHGKVGRGECAIVLRPHLGQALIVHAENGEAWQWSGTESDVVRRPETAISIPDSITLLKQAQRGKGTPGPISLRGQWKGKLLCDNGQPRVTLERKIASYGTLHIQSDASSDKWSWHIERAEKWFTPAGEKKGSSKTLVEAIRNGLASAMGLLGEACSVRDSRRRAAMDPEYAEKHPIKPAAEKKDPTEKYNPKPPKPPKQPKAPKRPTTPKAPRTPKTEATEQADATTKSTKAPKAPTTKAPATKKTAAPAPAPAAALPAVPAPTPSGPEMEIDPAKDKLLMDAFSAAIGQAIAQMGA